MLRRLQGFAVALVLLALVGVAVAANPPSADDAIKRGSTDLATQNSTWVQHGALHGWSGATWTAASYDTSGNANVNVVGGTGGAVVSVDGQIDVSTTTTIPASALSGRTSLTLTNAGGTSFTSTGSTLVVCHIAGAAVLTTGGVILWPGIPVSLTMAAGTAVQCISASGTVRLAYVEGK